MHDSSLVLRHVVVYEKNILTSPKNIFTHLARIKEKRIATKQQMQSSLTKSTSSFLTSSRRHFSRTSSSFSSRHKQQQQQHKRKSSFVTKAGAEEEELMQKLMAMIGGGAPAGRPPKGQMIAKESAIKGRDSEMRVTEEHYVLVR